MGQCYAEVELGIPALGEKKSGILPVDLPLDQVSFRPLLLNSLGRGQLQGHLGIIGKPRAQASPQILGI